MEFETTVNKAREQDERLEVTEGEYSGCDNVSVSVLPFTCVDDETAYTLVSRLSQYTQVDEQDVFVIQVREDTEPSMGEMYDEETDVFDEKVCVSECEGKAWLEWNRYASNPEDATVIEDVDEFIEDLNSE